MDDCLVWMDLEMTGLNPDTAVIVEIATLVTDRDANLVAEGPVIAISHPPEVVAAMDSWSREHHEKSGLLARMLASKIDTAEAERLTLAFVAAHVKEKTAPLCGNSIWQDRRFLVKYMPALNEYLHYRMVDVSTIKELAKRWYPNLPRYEKKNTHTALSDIMESIEELKFYRRKLFVKPEDLQNS